MRRFVTVLAAVLICSFCLADDIKAVMDDMKRAYKDVKTAKVTMEMKIPAFDGDDQDFPPIEFEVSLRATGLERMSVKAGDEDPFVSISDGDKVIWTSKGTPDDSDKSDDDDDDSDWWPTDFFFDIDNVIATDKDGAFDGTSLDVHDESWNDKNWTVVQETYSEQSIVRRFYIDPKTHLVWRITDSGTDDDKVQVEYEVKSIELNPKLEDDLFKPPL